MRLENEFRRPLFFSKKDFVTAPGSLLATGRSDVIDFLSIVAAVGMKKLS